MKTILIVGSNKRTNFFEEFLKSIENIKVEVCRVEEIQNFNPDLIISAISSKDEEVYLYDSRIPFITQNELREGLISQNGMFGFTIETIAISILNVFAVKKMEEIVEANLFFAGTGTLNNNWFNKIRKSVRNSILSKVSFTQWFPKPFDGIQMIYRREDILFNRINISRHYGKVAPYSIQQKLKAFIVRSSKPYQKASIRIDFWGRKDEIFKQYSLALIFDEIDLYKLGIELIIKSIGTELNYAKLFNEAEIINTFKKNIKIMSLE